MGQISDSAIIVLAIVSAGVVVLIGWAIGHRLWQDRDEDEESHAYVSADVGTSQYNYMRDLREKYKEGIFASTGFGGGRSKRPRAQSRGLDSSHMDSPSGYGPQGPPSAGASQMMDYGNGTEPPSTRASHYYRDDSSRRPSAYWVE